MAFFPVLLFLFLWHSPLCAGQNIVFDLASYDPANKTTHTLEMLANLTAGTTEIQVVNLLESVGFYIVQVHTFLSNVTLSSTSEMETQTFITGRNVGLVSQSKSDTTFYVMSQQGTTALIVIVIYEDTDPIPGGCNLTFDTVIAPYQVIVTTDDLIVVQSQAPSASEITCEKNDIQVEMYHLYLPEKDYEENTYFQCLERLLTVDNIRVNGYRVETVDGYFKYRKLYSAYRGVGQVFAIVATFKNRSSAYVPAVSYGCDVANKEESCYGPVTPHWKLICAIFLIFGLFVCFFGHKYFRTTLYLIGLAVGIFITYTILSLNENLGVAEKTTTSMLIGLIYASFWLFIWWKFGVPILSISVTFFLAGYLIASILFYSGVADFEAFHNDISFWLTQFSMIIALSIIWTMFTLQGHIFACSLLGSYACVSALNYYTGGNLQYIIINSFRRIIVKNFNMATIDPPFQILDISQTILWSVLVGFGFYYQMKEQRGKPPFPPPRYATVANGVSEATPLLRESPPAYMA